MKKIFYGLFIAMLLISCGNKKTGKSTKKDAKQEKKSSVVIRDLNSNSPDCDQYVLMSTSYGDIKIKLYRETPLHRKNFINLVKNGYYNGQIFYRVISGSLIQAGDYATISDPNVKEIGTHDVDYTVPAEIDPSKRIHKRGALAAASNNRGNYSSGGHFYIVSNKKVKPNDIDAAEKAYTKELVNKKFLEVQKPYLKELNDLKSAGKNNQFDEKVNKLYNEARRAVKDYHYPASLRNLYTKQGGMPSLDPHYTVFGEVVEGMDVVDAISQVKVYEDRPRENVFIKSVIVINGNK